MQNAKLLITTRPISVSHRLNWKQHNYLFDNEQTSSFCRDSKHIFDEIKCSLLGRKQRTLDISKYK